MSWLADLASKAENILNTIDETTATALHSNQEETTSFISKEVNWYL